MTTTRTAYELAEARVTRDDELNELKSIILHTDWTEGDDHYEWVANAPREEILDWARDIDRNCFPNG